MNTPQIIPTIESIMAIAPTAFRNSSTTLIFLCMFMVNPKDYLKLSLAISHFFPFQSTKVSFFLLMKNNMAKKVMTRIPNPILV